MEAIRVRIGVSTRHGPPAVWHPLREQGEETARAALGITAYTETFEAGKCLSLAGALTEAMTLAEAIAAESVHLHPPAT